MRVVIFGAGYVGCVSGACLASLGHSIHFIEPNATKVARLNEGKSPIVEPGLEELIGQGVRSEQLKASIFVGEALIDCDMVFVAVATPSKTTGAINLSQVKAVFSTILEQIKRRKKKLIVVLRSTLHPNALKEIYQTFNLEFQPLISVVFHPEFLRESTAIVDFFSPPFCVAGGEDPYAVQKVFDLYASLEMPKITMNLYAAALLKYACNAFHALKIAFANEMGSICQSLEVNPQEVMEVFVQDEVLNCSKAYLRPGFSFGGSCLPKDLRVLLSLTRALDQQLPLLQAILPSNQHHFEKVLERLLEDGMKKMVLVGLSFKKQNDDLRESPFVELAERLLGKGIELSIYDPDVKQEFLTGANLSTFSRRYGHLFDLLESNFERALLGKEAVILAKDVLDEGQLAAVQELVVYDLQHQFKKKETVAVCCT